MGLIGSPSVLVAVCIVIKYCLVVMESIVVRAAPRVLANQVPCPDEVLALHQVRCLARLAELWGGEGVREEMEYEVQNIGDGDIEIG